MSLSGWSAGDLVLFAKLAYDVCGYYQSAPQSLRQPLQRFQYIAQHLEELSDVLKKSDWPGYDTAPKLKDDLREAKHFFENYAPLSTANIVSTSRLSDIARPGVRANEGKLREIDKKMKDHMEKMNAFKQHIILVCSLKNLELAQRLQANSPVTSTFPGGGRSIDDDREDNVRQNSLTIEADNISVISTAFSAIKLASRLKKGSSNLDFERDTRRMQSSLEPALSTSPVLDALTAASEREAINDFIDEIVGLSEQTQLYSKNPSQPQSPQQLAKITSTAMKLCDSLLPQQYGASTSPKLTLREVGSPIESFRNSIFSTLSNYSNTDIAEWSENQADAREVSPRFSDKATSMVGEDSHRTDAVGAPAREVQREQSSASISESGSFIMDIGPPAKQRLAFTVWLFETNTVGVAPIECTLDYAESNGNTPFCSITAIAVNQRRKSPSLRSDTSSIALTPQTHLDLRANDEIHDIRETREHKRIFNHKFNPNHRPFPHVLHPVVEGPDLERKAPYTITFTVPQQFEEEGVTLSPITSTKLKYIFSDKEDRDVLQSLIFGKFLLFSAGIKTIVTSGPTTSRCDAQQALRLWLSKDGRVKSVTVYFKDSKHPQKLYKEYHVHRLKSDPRKLKAGTAVTVLVSEEVSVGASDSTRRSSNTSSQTLSSKGSADSATSKPLDCSLHFSRDKDREEFLRYFT